MALGNIIKEGSYSIIGELDFSYHDKRIIGQLKVYSNSSKSTVITTVPFRFMVPDVFTSIKSTKIKTLPLTVSSGDKFIIPTGATGEWEENTGKMAAFSTSRGWEYSNPVAGQYYLIEDENQMYIYNGIDSAFRKMDELLSAIKWELYFGFGILSAANNNIIRSVYTYLKNTDIAKNATDI